jgi:hypothetical protein
LNHVYHPDHSLNFGLVRQVPRRFGWLAPAHPVTIRAEQGRGPNLSLWERWAKHSRLRPGLPAWTYLTSAQCGPVTTRIRGVRAGRTSSGKSRSNLAATRTPRPETRNKPSHRLVHLRPSYARQEMQRTPQRSQERMRGCSDGASVTSNSTARRRRVRSPAGTKRCSGSARTTTCAVSRRYRGADSSAQPCRARRQPDTL